MKFYECKTEEDVVKALERLPDVISIDTETDSKDHRVASLHTVVVSDGSCAYGAPAAFLSLFSSKLKNLKCLILQKFDYDYIVLHRHGLDLSSVPFLDIRILHHLIDENQEHSLDYMVQTEYGDNYKQVFWDTFNSYEEAPPDKQLEYVCKDGIYTARLCKLFLERLQGKEALIEHVHRLAKALYFTERDGVNVDLKAINTIGDRLKIETIELRSQMRNQVNHWCTTWELSEWTKELDKRKTDKGKAHVTKPDFNFDSTKQLGELLYDYLGLPVQLSKKKKSRTVDDAALEVLEPKHTIISLIRSYREKQKIYGTYVEGMLERHLGGIIYPEFNVCGTVTGRISSKNPNLQNIPRDNSIRSFFVPAEGFRFISADYSQLEICLAAHFSADPVLIDIVKSGASMHDHTTELLKAFKIPRQQCKNINFALIYGAQEYKISSMVGCSQAEAKDIMETLWQGYKGLKDIIDFCHKSVDDGKPITNPFGRTRSFGTNFESHWERERAKRQAFNALVQGTGGDICNRAYYLVSERLRKNNNGRAVWPIHDEINIEIEDAYCQEEREALISIMQDVGKELNLLVPLTATASEPMKVWGK